MTLLELFGTHVNGGGLSTCIHDGDLKNPWWRYFTLSNCTALCWMLFNLDHNRELQAFAKKLRMKRITGNARDIYRVACAKGSGFKCNYEPLSNSIACYGAGTSTGHVVYILHVWKNGQAVGIESNYSGNMANGLALRVKYGKPKNWYKQYQGCIYDFT